MTKRSFFLASVIATLSVGISACSSSGSADGSGGTSSASDSPSCKASTCPVDVTGVDLTTPEISFKTDVYPIFEATCNDSSCHGMKNGNSSAVAAGLVLGSDPSEGAATDAVLSQTYLSVTGTSQFASGMQRVKPGDWANSFLMLKVDGCQNSGVADCSGKTVDALLSECGTDCGDGMPQVTSTGPNVSYPVSDADILTIRKWIQQGAKNN